MDSQTRNAYEGLSREDWVKLGYLHNDVPLTRNFHPIFQRTNASRPALAEHIWPQFKEEDQYQRLCAVMGNVFQLASNILESPESLDFLYQVAYSPRRVADKGLSNKGRPCKEFGWIEPPSKGYARQMARDALRRLSNSLSFTIGDPAANPALGHAVAVTGFVLEGFEDGVKINDASGQSGMASRITINQEFLVMLTELETQEEDTTWQKMSMELKLAITLCHEIGVCTTLTIGITLGPVSTAGSYYDLHLMYVC